MTIQRIRRTVLMDRSARQALANVLLLPFFAMGAALAIRPSRQIQVTAGRAIDLVKAARAAQMALATAGSLTGLLAPTVSFASRALASVPLRPLFATWPAGQSA